MPTSDGSTNKASQNGNSSPTTTTSSSSTSGPPPVPVETELAKALQELARGEQAASSLESDLSRLEQRLDEILAAFEGSVAPTAAASKAEPKPEGDSKAHSPVKKDGDTEGKS